MDNEIANLMPTMEEVEPIGKYSEGRSRSSMSSESLEYRLRNLPDYQNNILRYDQNLKHQMLYRVNNVHELSANIDIYIAELLRRKLIDESEVKKLSDNLIKNYYHPERDTGMGTTQLKDYFPDSPINVNLTIPNNYSLDRHKGVILHSFDKKGYPVEELITPYILLPLEKVISSSSSGVDITLRLIIWNIQRQEWVYFNSVVPKKSLSNERDILSMDNTDIITIGDTYKKALSMFMTELFIANNNGADLPIKYAFDSCGWTKQNTFFPFTTDNTKENLIFLGEEDTTVSAIFNKVQKPLRGTYQEAVAIINELKDNPVFGIMLAGALASPIVSKLEGLLDENIGIDLFGKSSSGKTLTHMLVLRLIYGLGIDLKSSWSGTSEAAIWNKLKELRHLPLIMDDSHGMKDDLCQLPHHMLNGTSGDKSKKTNKGDWKSGDVTKNIYRGVIFFNGEIPVASKAPRDSAGIHGRIIKVALPPFPSHYNAQMVDDLKLRAERNGGYFAKPWLEHITTKDIDEINENLIRISPRFNGKNKDRLYSRLITKASLLIYCIEQFNQLFDTQINVERIYSVLLESMVEGTSEVGVADTIMQDLFHKAWDKISPLDLDEKNCIIVNYHNPTGLYLDHNLNSIVYKINQKNDKDNCLIIKSSLFEQLTKEIGCKNSKQARQILKNGGYLETDDFQTYRYPSSGEDDRPRMYGVKFHYSVIKKLIDAAQCADE